MSILDRVAGAPITWGVDGSPGWGHLMDPDRVLAEMVEVGLRATELGPDGYLGADTAEVLERLERHGLSLVAGFVPVVMYRKHGTTEQLEYFARAAGTLRAGGAPIAVLGADSHHPGYDAQVQLSDDEWGRFFTNLSSVQEIAALNHLTVALHPHWGMAIEDQSDVDRLLARSTTGLCVDTGHLALAGVDALSLVEKHADRVHHVHLKDLSAKHAERVRSGAIGFRQAVIDGMFRPLGDGCIDIAGVITALEFRGFSGWYVLEQDVALTADPAPGRGPINDARRSMDFLRDLAASARFRQEGTAE